MNEKKFFELIKGRRSVRFFSGKRVPAWKIRRVIEAGTWAPSSCNRQPWRVIVIRDAESKKKVFSWTGGQKMAMEADTLLLVTVDLTRYLEKEGGITPYIDAGAFLENALLEAHALGLGACCIAGAHDDSTLRDGLRIPEAHKPVALIVLGYPSSGKIRAPDRGPPEKYFSLDSFSARPIKHAEYVAWAEERTRISRSGMDVSRDYSRPREWISFFQSAKKRIYREIEDAGAESMLLTYSGMGFYLDGLPATVKRVYSLAQSADERWFVYKFKGIRGVELIDATPFVFADKSGKKIRGLDFIVSFFDSNFMTVSDLRDFGFQAEKVLRKGGKLAIIFFKTGSPYSLNRAVKLRDRVRLCGHEKPVSHEYVEKGLKSSGLRLVKKESTCLMPVLNVAHVFPFTPFVFPADAVDLLLALPFLKNAGSVGIAVYEK